MLKLNLKKGLTSIPWRPLKLWAAGVLFLILIGQVFSWIQSTSEYQRKHAELTALKSRLQALQEQKNALVMVENPELLSGSIGALNEWIKQREKSPVFILAKLERERPGAVELKSFESDGTRGTIKMEAGDLDTASRYMNAVFGNANVRVTMEERVRNGILAVCLWNE